MSLISESNGRYFYNNLYIADLQKPFVYTTFYDAKIQRGYAPREKRQYCVLRDSFTASFLAKKTFRTQLFYSIFQCNQGIKLIDLTKALEFLFSSRQGKDLVQQFLLDPINSLVTSYPWTSIISDFSLKNLKRTPLISNGLLLRRTLSGSDESSYFLRVLQRGRKLYTCQLPWDLLQSISLQEVSLSKRKRRALGSRILILSKYNYEWVCWLSKLLERERKTDDILPVVVFS